MQQHPRRHFPLQPRRALAGWWLGLCALVLLLAQMAASWHLLEHALAGAAQASAHAQNPMGAKADTGRLGYSVTDGENATAPDACALCLSAGALLGSAVPLPEWQTPARIAVQQLPGWVPELRWLARLWLAYQSRAPPLVFD